MYAFRNGRVSPYRIAVLMPRCALADGREWPKGEHVVYVAQRVDRPPRQSISRFPLQITTLRQFARCVPVPSSVPA